MEKIIWNTTYQVKILEEEQIFLLSEFDHVLLKGKVYHLLAPFISNGAYSEDELVDCLSGKTPPEMVYYALSRLRTKNLIVQQCEGLPEELRAVCSLLNVQQNDALKALSSMNVAVTALDGIARPEFMALLDSYNIKKIDSVAEADLAVLIVHDYLEKEIAAFHQTRGNKPWMLLRDVGAQAWIGPFFEQDKTGCYNCLAKRLKHNRQEDVFFLSEETPLIPSKSKLPSVRHAAWNIAATELLKRLILGKSDSLEGKILIFDPLRIKLESHTMQKLPSCLHCGHADPKPEHNLLCLQSRTSRDPFADGYRTKSPEETLQQYAHLVSPVTGIVKYLAKADQPIGSAGHVYMSGTNWALPASAQRKSISSFRNFSSGKGTSETIAKAGALCEALERFSGLYQEGDIAFCAPFHTIKQSAIHPERILLISDKQYQMRNASNSHSQRFARISDPFPEEKEVAWTAVYSLTEKRTKYVPTAVCYFGYKDPHWTHGGDSNGCAAGNCIEEAILQGFFELAERDSVAIWWYNRLLMPAVDLDSFAIPFISLMQKEYKNAGREIWALDLTTDLGIPTFAAISRLIDHEHEKILFGFGTHFDAQSALLRALTELNQMASNTSFWEEEDMADGEQEKNDKKFVQNWMRNSTVENQPYLGKKGAYKKASDYVKWQSSDLLEDVQRCQKIVESLGMEFLVLDQTRPDVGLPVARVIVPGLRHFWVRFAPGRLYDVPVKMGWLTEPTAEPDLNPIPLFV
ncbi:MAG: TOMM precursor leader peptide-binding protein [Verrucomicrobia bacterium]|nr:TOMM precursor leader peptide-binding protein [Verrucomicrobiota bacterium]